MNEVRDSARRRLRSRWRLTVGVALTIGALPFVTPLGAGVALAGSTNANFVGTWNIVDPADSSITATLVVTDEDAATGRFDGTVTALGAQGPAFQDPFDVLDGRVKGNSFSFRLERDGIGDRDAVYNADISGVISDNNFSGYLHSTIEPPVSDDVSAFVGNRSLSGTRVVFKVSGTVMFGCTASVCSSTQEPLYDATVDVDGDSSETTTTNAHGAWSVSVPPGEYSITPSSPGIAFSPGSLDVNVTKDVDHQDFSGCGASDTAGDDARAPLIKSATSSGYTTLTGNYCHNTYGVILDPKSVVAYVSWTANPWTCDGQSGPVADPNPGGPIFTKNIVGGTKAPGDVEKLKNGSFEIRVRDQNNNLVMYITINASLDGGTVTTHGSSYGGQVAVKDEGLLFCHPYDATKLPIPFPQTSI